MDSLNYEKYSLEKEKKFDELCGRCGQCCGALDDPCRDLVKLDNGTYFCMIYDKRFGRRETVSGKAFNCVPIREHIAKGALRPGCSYRSVTGS
ncbi:MAG: hypothetical protein U9R44_03570 [Candidatus Omnitrophota bacterium]|nr:hypothetical protein [Candidatus Omnitrophota bacterium]